MNPIPQLPRQVFPCDGPRGTHLFAADDREDARAKYARKFRCRLASVKVSLPFSQTSEPLPPEYRELKAALLPIVPAGEAVHA